MTMTGWTGRLFGLEKIWERLEIHGRWLGWRRLTRVVHCCKEWQKETHGYKYPCIMTCWKGIVSPQCLEDASRSRILTLSWSHNIFGFWTRGNTDALCVHHRVWSWSWPRVKCMSWELVQSWLTWRMVGMVAHHFYLWIYMSNVLGLVGMVE